MRPDPPEPACRARILAAGGLRVPVDTDRGYPYRVRMVSSGSRIAKFAAAASVAAIAGGLVASCAGSGDEPSKTESPSPTTSSSSPPSTVPALPNPTEKGMTPNGPNSFGPTPGAGGHNPAVPCGYGPDGGFYCSGIHGGLDP